MSVVDEPEQGCPVVIVFDVQHDRAFVAVDQLPPQTLAVSRVTPRHVAQAVAAWPLDLDDVGPEVGKVASAVRPGEHRRHVDDTNVGQRAV